MDRDAHEQNRRSWNNATRRHNAHKLDQVAFLRAGGSTLFPEELGLLGDIAGLRLAHLQCNAGQDTLSLARLGARVVGIDISDDAIAFAERLSIESGIPARFERGDVYDWLDAAPEASLDVVFFSYGALCWLSDLNRWAKGIARVLVPGGRLVGIEFHPVGQSFEGDRWSYPYLHEHALRFAEGVGDYVGEAGGALSPGGHQSLDSSWQNPEGSVEWAWSLSKVVMALVRAGLQLERFEEYGYTNGCDLLGGQIPIGDRRFGPPPGLTGLPLMYSVVARR